MPGDDGGSVTRWIGGLKAGDAAAARRSGSVISTDWSAWPGSDWRAGPAASRTRKTRP